ncbi:MAG TPA: error-prone DNA polymerase [Opitutaceae bacterium]|nr:error-prone DNA polymerase [Opitutaceae bacterium]
MDYVELHARSAFSFLRGGSTPEALGEEASRLGLPALALCDRDGVYGAARLFSRAQQAGGGRPLVGCELTMEDGSVVPVLAASQAGYRQLCALLTTAHLRAPKGEGRVAWAELAEGSGGLIALTGDEEGPVRRAWRERGGAAAAEAGARLRRIFGADRLYAELQRHHLPGEEEENAWLVDWARAERLPLLATNGVLHADPAGRRVADLFTCLRLHTTLDGAGRALARNDERHLKPAGAMAALFADLPEAVGNTLRLAERLEFTLADLGYRFPDFPVAPGETQAGRLAAEVWAGARERYGTVGAAARRQIERELALITRLEFCGYFLIVWDICRFARERGILVQGRGSAANSAVCYVLGITAVDPIENHLLFERFLSEGRTGSWPDIDLDLPSGERREEVLQELWRRYGRRGAAMTANVITYRGRSTMREVGKALGLPDDLLDRFSKLFHHGDYANTLAWREQLRMAGLSDGHPRLPALLDLSAQLRGLPRHLGQHSGGMILSGGRLDHFVPLENARMPGRSVVQWDKDDCEDLGLVKVDFLGLGMMAVLQDALEICSQRGEPVDLAKLPKDDPETYRMIREADTVGVFQIESRAQMATLPRMQPKTFYDLVVEVAIIRPGPIHGDAVNPYLERRAGRQEVTYPDPRAEPILKRTLGVVLFQEQILRLAMELGGFSPAEADELRRAIGFKRTDDRLRRSEEKLGRSLLANGVSREATAAIIKSLAAFSLYGFPESHAISFALLAYASAWLKAHKPAAFYTALLNCQPMGFYSSATLVQDGRRHGLRFLPVCVRESGELARVVDARTVRLGLAALRGVRRPALRRLLAARAGGPFASSEDFLRRTNFNPKERRLLASSGALNALAGHRREALWRVEALREGDDLFRAARAEEEATLSPLERMTHLERLQADYATTGLTAGNHPMRVLRPQLPGLCPAGELPQRPNGERVRVGGAVITRQRPGTAKGVCFITLEDETGHANAIVWPSLFEARRLTINLEGALLITGRVQNERNVTHLMAEEIEPLPLAGLPVAGSHDFR